MTTSERVVNRHITHFNLIFSGDARSVATGTTASRQLAERTRLGIPVTISSDPRHSTGEEPGYRHPHEGVLTVAGSARVGRDPG